jgi:hypothetical protein
MNCETNYKTHTFTNQNSYYLNFDSTIKIKKKILSKDLFFSIMKEYKLENSTINLFTNTKYDTTNYIPNKKYYIVKYKDTNNKCYKGILVTQKPYSYENIINKYIIIDIKYFSDIFQIIYSDTKMNFNKSIQSVSNKNQTKINPHRIYDKDSSEFIDINTDMLSMELSPKRTIILDYILSIEKKIKNKINNIKIKNEITEIINENKIRHPIVQYKDYSLNKIYNGIFIKKIKNMPIIIDQNFITEFIKGRRKGTALKNLSY